MKNLDIINRIETHKPYSNLDYYYGPYTSLAHACQMVPIKIRQIGLTVAIIENGRVVEYWWQSGITDEDLVSKLGDITNELTAITDSITEHFVPIYDSIDLVPPSGNTTVPDNVLVLNSESPMFDQNQERDMMLQAIYALQQEVSLIKRSFTDHMNGGDFENDKLIITGNDPTVQEEEPLWASDTGVPLLETSGRTIDAIEPQDPNILKITHLTIKSGKSDDLLTVMNYLLPDEMVWVYDKKRMYIKQRDGSLFWLNSGNEPSIITGITNNPTGTTIDMSNLESITFISPNSNKYLFRINNNGDTEIINQKTEIIPDIDDILTSGIHSGFTQTLYLPKLYINSLYCGGMNGESPNPSKYQPCSHNFVELSNLTNSDIGLNNISLRYSINGSIWETLHLEGVIKAQSTFLIRGAKCSVIEANTTIIKVNTYDMEWYDSNDSLIQFSNIKCKFLLEYTGTGDTSQIAAPYVQDGIKGYCTSGYIDMVGLNKTGATTPEKIDGYEQTRFEQLVPSSRMYLKYYQMDPVSQATKAIGSRSNSADWTWIELTKKLQPNIELYTPKASFENKNIFFDKSKLRSDQPNMVTVTFGRNAHTTRCFNWISVGYYDEYLSYRLAGETSWIKVESFKEGDNRSTYTNKYYNRIRVIATDKTPYTAHKMIITDLQPGTYEYKCGRDGYESDISKFKVQAESISDFSFVQTSDQQGFNWCEYEVWKKAADFIKYYENPTFTINTGDMTQNGNRISEWIDYYNAGKSLFSPTNASGDTEFNGVEQMTVVGNNDLSPQDYEFLGDGSDLSKINAINFLFFYTYEMDEDNLPIMTNSGSTYYIPSLYSFDYNDCHFIVVNSEISENTETYLYDNLDVYSFIKTWCENDLGKTTKKWKIAACHEMPFSIITNALITEYLNNNSIARGGSRINTVVKNGEPYWFSRLLEKHNVKLCIGGHKHTYSATYPIRENYVTGITGNTYYSMKPIIQVLDSVYNYTDISGNTPYKTIFDAKAATQLCEIEIVTGITAPRYIMCQSTGYKQTSNKELPAENIPWLENYFPASMSSGTPAANNGQKYPFYIKWDVASDTITGTVVKINNIMTSGKFNINTQNSAPLSKMNGNGGSNSPIIITLN